MIWCVLPAAFFSSLFQVISVSIIAWRVYTFNDCEEAAKELKQEIADAKADLIKKGFKLD
jgi:dolichyl-phosphate mannosyltransferase polypeptide 3